MKSELHHQQRHMGRLLLIHCAAVIILPMLFDLFGGFWDYLLVLLVMAVALSIYDRRYASYLYWSLAFLLYLARDIVTSNLVMARIALQPKPQLEPGIIAVPLTVNTGLEITVLALAISLTPGTLIIELGRDDEGRYVLYVHALNVGEPDEFRATMKNGLERMILNISRGVTT